MAERKRRILVVEDEIIVALDLCMRLDEAGYETIGPAGRIAEALALLDGDAPDLAVLDANLDGQTPCDVAERLGALGVPFLYVSGYSAEHIREILPPAPLFGKPVLMDALLAEIRGRFV